jgi:hypothetical protein
VHDQQGAAEFADPALLRLIREVLEELLADEEGTAAQAELGLPVEGDAVTDRGDEVLHVPGVRRGADGGDGLDLRDVLGGGDGGGAPE